MRKIYLILIIIFALAVLLFIVFRFMPARYITAILGRDNSLSSLACSYPVKVTGDSMEPYFKNGQTAYFNKCFQVGDLGVNNIIVFNDGEVNRLGAIDKIEDLESGIVYKIVQPNRADLVTDVFPDQIRAVYKEDFDSR